MLNNNIYSKNISVFRNYWNTEPALSISVPDFCGNIIQGDYQEEVEAIRSEPDKKSRDKMKAKLPAATVSGTFSERNRSGLIKHSGFIALDLDAKENPQISNWPELRDKLGTIENVCFSALSVSGQGVFVMIPLAVRIRHEAHFDALSRDFKSMGLTIDSSCRDVSRLRGISYDPDAKFNENAKPYQRTYQPQRERYNRTASTIHGDDLNRLLDMVTSSGADLTDGYENWFEIGRALANELGEGGRAWFHRISQAHHKYNDAKCDKQYNACLRSPGRATKGTLFHLAKEHGITLTSVK